MRKSRLLVLLVIFLGAGAGVYYRFFREKPVEVAVHEVTRGRMEKLVANTRSGTVKPCRRAGLTPQAPGRIAELFVREGDKVKSGQKLLRLWDDDLKAGLQLAKSDAIMTRARAGEVCLRADTAAREAARLKQLDEKELVSKSKLDQVETAAKAGKASCEAARAGVEVSKARVAVAESRLEQSRLAAPFDGIVAEVNGEVGEFITPSPTGIATLPAVDLIDPSCLYVAAPIDEMDAPAVRVGMTARITLDGFRDKGFTGSVRRIAPYVRAVEKQARTVEVEAGFNGDGLPANMLPGYSADMEIVVTSLDNVIKIPGEAVVDNEYVLLLRPEDNRLERRAVKTGLTGWRFTEITEGLASGDLVVITPGREGVEAGLKARVEE